MKYNDNNNAQTTDATTTETRTDKQNTLETSTCSWRVDSTHRRVVSIVKFPNLTHQCVELFRQLSRTTHRRVVFRDDLVKTTRHN